MREVSTIISAIHLLCSRSQQIMTIRNIAVLGTSSGVATTITAKLRSNPSNAVRILSRSPRPNRENVRVVDYGSVSSLSKALEGVDTIVSFLAIYDYDEDIRVNENVIEAAKAVGVKRFIPCEYIAGDQCNIKIKALKSKPEIRKLAAASGLEYTFIHNGYFTNYFAQGSPKNKDGEGMSGLPGYSLNIDLEKKTARVTGTGDEKIVFTRLEDVASAVAGLVESDEKWNPDSWVVGDSKSWNEVLDLAKKISGMQ